MSTVIAREIHERNIEASTKRMLGQLPPSGSCQLTFFCWNDQLNRNEMVNTTEVATVRQAYLQGRHWLKARNITSFRIEGEGVGDFNISEEIINHTHSRECIHCGEIITFSKAIMRPEIVGSYMDRHMRRCHESMWKRVGMWIAAALLVVVVLSILFRNGVL